MVQQSGKPRLKIGLIDDNDDNRLVFRTFLEDCHDVIEFADGEQAMQGMKQNPPDVVFLDISLPGMDGVEILRRIRGDVTLCRLRVIAYTAHAMLGDRERFLKLGFDGYLSKPIHLNTITQIIDRAARAPAAGAGA